jgi:hypothetical protein
VISGHQILLLHAAVQDSRRACTFPAQRIAKAKLSVRSFRSELGSLLFLLLRLGANAEVPANERVKPRIVEGSSLVSSKKQVDGFKWAVFTKHGLQSRLRDWITEPSQ